MSHQPAGTIGPRPFNAAVEVSSDLIAVGPTASETALAMAWQPGTDYAVGAAETAEDAVALARAAAKRIRVERMAAFQQQQEASDEG
jgi:hypothetical protein